LKAFSMTDICAAGAANSGAHDRGAPPRVLPAIEMRIPARRRRFSSIRVKRSTPRLINERGSIDREVAATSNDTERRGPSFHTLLDAEGASRLRRRAAKVGRIPKEIFMSAKLKAKALQILTAPDAPCDPFAEGVKQPELVLQIVKESLDGFVRENPQPPGQSPDDLADVFLRHMTERSGR
jgi:hypothetical protein